MSFGKRQVEQASRELSQAASVMPRAESSLGTIVLICIAVAVVGAITYVAFSKGAVNANSAALASQSAPSRAAKAGPVKVVDKVVTHDDNGRIGNEVIYYSNGVSESRDYSYNAAGKLERVTSRSSDGKLSITVHH